MKPIRTVYVAAATLRAAYWWRAAITGAGVGRRMIRPPRTMKLRPMAEVASGGIEVAGRNIYRDVPRLSHYRITSTGWQARVKLRPGQKLDDLVKASESLREAFRASGIVFEPGHRPGYVTMRVARRDPLLDPPRWRPVALTPTTLRVGVVDSGDPFDLDLRKLPHWLVIGATGSGKSTLVQAAFAALAPTDAAVIGLDLKWGVELGPLRPRLTDLAVDQAGAVALLERVLELCARRATVCLAAGVRSVWELPEGHPCRRLVVVLVDEVAELLIIDPKDKDHAKALSSLLLRTVQLARAFGVTVLVAGQRFGSDLGPTATSIRAQLAGRLICRVDDPETARMVVGDLAADAVLAAQAIKPETPGVAVFAGGSHGWRRLRSLFVDAATATVLAKKYAGNAPTWDQLVPDVAPVDLDALTDAVLDIDPAAPVTVPDRLGTAA